MWIEIDRDEISNFHKRSFSGQVNIEVTRGHKSFFYKITILLQTFALSQKVL